jgi:hypothetical protein
MDKKSLVKQIKNLAAELISRGAPPPPLTISPPKEAPKSVPSTSSTGFVGSPGAVMSEVKEMQTAMQDLARTVILNTRSALMPQKGLKDIKFQQDLTPEGKAVVQSKTAFNDFIAEQYMNTLPPSKKGVEWNADKTKTQYPQKQPGQTDIYQLNVVMDTLERIGNPYSSEFKVDGVWNWRTDNALRNMLAFTYALIQLEGDFGLKDNGIYTEKDLNTFQQTMSYEFIPGQDPKLTNDEKKNKAKILTPNLKKVGQLYEDFRRQVLAHPEYRGFIEGTKSFGNYAPTPLVSDEMALINQSRDNPKKGVNMISGLNFGSPSKGVQNSVPLYVLSDMNSFKSYMTFLGYTEEQINNPEWPSRLLRVIKDQIQSQGGTK